MSLLPQRKKSAEEIAKLRETLGVPALQEVENEAETPAIVDEIETLVSTHHEAIVEQHPAADVPDTIIPGQHEAKVVHHPAAPEPATPAPTKRLGPKPVHSLKRSERLPETPEEPTDPDPTPVSHLSKPVRSLRKSEQVPVLVPTPEKPSPDSKIPFHRHSDEEIAAIRRRDALAMLNPPPPNPKLAAAHFALLIPGYLCAIAGAACFFFYEFPMVATAACAAIALVISAFVFVRRPLSRHHAGFISVIALFVIVFGTLHYFPHLQHAT